MSNPSALITLIVYAVVLVGIGVWASRRVRSEAGFLLGDRGLGPLVAGLAYAASGSSAWVLLGFSGFVYAVGVSALWMIPGVLLGNVLVWLVAGPTLQRASHEGGALTLTDFLSANASAPMARAIRIAASLMIVFCFAYYVAGQFQGAGVAIDGLFDSGLAFGVVTGALVIVAYTFLGGFFAISLTDTLQGCLMAFVAILLPIVAFTQAGGAAGLSGMFAQAPAPYGDAFGGQVGVVAVFVVIGMVSVGFGALGQPQLVAWIMATRDTRARLAGAAVATTWSTVVFSGMGVLGLSARTIFGAEAPPEGVFLMLAEAFLPGVLAGVVGAAVLSAIMSTADNLLLVTGAAVSHDLRLGRAFGGREVLVSRVAILVVCALAVLLTLYMPDSIFDRALFAWTALGAAFGPVVFARALGARLSGGVALAVLLLGFSVALLYEFVLPSGPGGMLTRIVPWCATLLLIAGAVLF
ncbi:MAG: sodium/proline symporter, partial [Caulobacterales bacterium]|nr:sodium/proline symporter [Caulobacterales bacterium]